jgi:peptidoglycan/LPS O-acetylase OafA/YrhL
MTLKRNTKVLLKNYYLLDLLRGAAALSVVFYHHQHFYRLTAGYDSKFSKESQPYYSILSYFYNNGSIAVELFWTISGFVLALNYFQNSKSRKSFFRNRFARLYPLHFFTLALVVLLQTWSKAFIGHFQIYPTNDVYHFFLNVFGIPFVGLEKDYSFNGPIWSVSVEIISYLIFGFILRFLRNSRILPFLILVLSIILFRIQPFNIGHSIYESFVFFFFGVALYRCYEYLSLVLRIFF